MLGALIAIAVACCMVGVLFLLARASTRAQVARLRDSDAARERLVELEAFADELTPILWRVTATGPDDLLRLEEVDGPRVWDLRVSADRRHGRPPEPGTPVRLEPLGLDGWFEVVRAEDWGDLDAHNAVAVLVHESAEPPGPDDTPAWPAG